MTREDDVTPVPPKRPSSMKISQWGIAQAWLAGGQRKFEVLCDDAGALVVAAVDVDSGARVTEPVAPDEDVSRAAVRALSGMK